MVLGFLRKVELPEFLFFKRKEGRKGRKADEEVAASEYFVVQKRKC